MPTSLKAKTKELLAYVVRHRYPDVSITELMKLSYLIDLVALKKKRSRLFDFEYVRYHYGPFDKKIYKYVKSLLADGTFVEGGRVSSTGDEFVTYRLADTRISHSKIKEEEMEILNEVLSAVEGHGAKALTELAYRTKPMKKIGAEIGNTNGLNETLDLTLVG